MNVLLDIVHPAHAHFFRHPIELLKQAGHDVTIASRDKDCTLALLDGFGLEHVCISSQNKGHPLAMARELLVRNRGLIALARRCRSDVISGVGGVAAAQSANSLGIPSVVFYDTEAARLQNALTYPLATSIVVPSCYSGRLPNRKSKRYRGYHELSYLHPARFEPDREVAIGNGLAESGDTFLIRLVSWQANHDLGLNGWTDETLDAVVEMLDSRGRVIISSEAALPEELREFQYSGDPDKIHHLLGHCRLLVGESATMASEAVVMGIPAVYAAPTRRGYISEQEERYGLARHAPNPSPSAVVEAIEGLL
jgi:hypothetical protein